MGLHSSRQHSMDPHRWSKIARDSPIGRGRCIWFIMPSRPHSCTMHLADDPRLVCWCGITYIIIWALTDGWQASSIYMETHEVIWMPPHPQGAPQGYCLENKVPPPWPSLLRVLFISMALMNFIKPLGGPNNMYYSSFDLLRGLLFCFSTILLLSPKVSYFAPYFILGANVGVIR